jgi:hypothetical protein
MRKAAAAESSQGGSRVRSEQIGLSNTSKEGANPWRRFESQYHVATVIV